MRPRTRRPINHVPNTTEFIFRDYCIHNPLVTPRERIGMLAAILKGGNPELPENPVIALKDVDFPALGRGANPQHALYYCDQARLIDFDSMFYREQSKYRTRKTTRKESQKSVALSRLATNKVIIVYSDVIDSDDSPQTKIRKLVSEICAKLIVQGGDLGHVKLIPESQFDLKKESPDCRLVVDMTTSKMGRTFHIEEQNRRLPIIKLDAWRNAEKEYTPEELLAKFTEPFALLSKLQSCGDRAILTITDTESSSKLNLFADKLTLEGKAGMSKLMSQVAGAQLDDSVYYDPQLLDRTEVTSGFLRPYTPESLAHDLRRPGAHLRAVCFEDDVLSYSTFFLNKRHMPQRGKDLFDAVVDSGHLKKRDGLKSVKFGFIPAYHRTSKGKYMQSLTRVDLFKLTTDPIFLEAQRQGIDILLFETRNSPAPNDEALAFYKKAGGQLTPISVLSQPTVTTQSGEQKITSIGSVMTFDVAEICKRRFG